MGVALAGVATLLQSGFAGGESTRAGTLALLVGFGLACFAGLALLTGAARMDDLNRILRRQRTAS